jgi:hypothetical protein
MPKPEKPAKQTGLANAASKVTNPTAKAAIARNQARQAARKTTTRRKT